LLLVCWGKSDGAVIDESLKAAAVPIAPNQLLSQCEEGFPERRRGRSIAVAFVGTVVKPVGKPDARNGHVRFDERGRETAGCL
jgi:hypothetical protein